MHVAMHVAMHGAMHVLIWNWLETGCTHMFLANLMRDGKVIHLGHFDAFVYDTCVLFELLQALLRAQVHGLPRGSAGLVKFALAGKACPKVQSAFDVKLFQDAALDAIPRQLRDQATGSFIATSIRRLRSGDGRRCFRCLRWCAQGIKAGSYRASTHEHSQGIFVDCHAAPTSA